MARATANGIELEYDTFGDRLSPPLLLVMGLGAQMTAWEEAFCRQLADRGLFVIRFDNRDCGLSSRSEGGPQPDLAAAFNGDTSSASYTLDDMAADAAGLLDALGIPRAHIAGASMGGMIVQTMAINHPDRVLSLCSIMSTTGNREVGQAKPEAMAVLMAPPAKGRAEAIEAGIHAQKVIGGTYPFDEAKWRTLLGAAYDRSFYPEGIARQLLAIIASGDRTERLRRLRLPTLVIHGSVDSLIDVSGGQATAEAIPGARLLIVPGMGHDLPEPAWPQIIDAMTALIRGA